MSNLKYITDLLIKFRDERDWEQFHDSKNLAAAISIEASELNELFLWKTAKDSENVDIHRLCEELADVFSFALLLADKHGIDPIEIIEEKIKINAKKYPIDKSKGTAKKYNEL